MRGDVRLEFLSHPHAPGVGPFAEALRTATGSATSFLPRLPASADAWSDPMAEARAGTCPLPAELVDALVSRQRVLGAGPVAVEAAQALAEPNTLAIVTGQQPGLLGGLLLAFHKAAGAIHLAKRLDAGPGRRVVPVFWLASEDHDLEEANRAFLRDRKGRSRRVRLDRMPDGRSLMHVPVASDEIVSVLAEAADLLPDTERARRVLAAVGGSSDESFATWCARGFAGLLGDAGIVILEPSLLAPFAGCALSGMVEQAAPIRKAVQVAERNLAEAGLPAPLSVENSYAPVFVRSDPAGPRQRVTFVEDGRLRVGRDGALQSPADLIAHLRARPALGSGDVVGRVFVQNSLLPVLAYVGGPTELAYLAQVRVAHEAVGLRFPVAVPRPEAVWVDAKTVRAVEAFGLTVPEFLAAPRPLSPVEDTDAAFTEAVKAWRSQVIAPPGELVRFGARPGERAAAMERAVKRLDAAFDRVARDLRAAAARDAGVGAERWTRILDALQPRGQPQERGLSALSVAARHGFEVFRDGLTHLDPLAPGYHILHVS